jgi:hypothetical protein
MFEAAAVQWQHWTVQSGSSNDSSCAVAGMLSTTMRALSILSASYAALIIGLSMLEHVHA